MEAQMKTVSHILFAACMATIIAACALLQPLDADDDARRAAKVVLTAYKATQQALLIYGRLPDCAMGTRPLCKERDLWRKLKAGEAAATQAIAEAAPVLNARQIDTDQLVAAIIAIENVNAILIDAQTILNGETP
jgi:hypothetical protein